MIARRFAGAGVAAAMALSSLAAVALEQRSPVSVETPVPQEAPGQPAPPPPTPDPQAGEGNDSPLQQPPDPPQVETAPTTEGMPAPNSVVGGGPLQVDQEAVARINEQMPVIPGAYQFSGGAALDYAATLTTFAPALAPTFQGIRGVADCGINHGVIAATAFVDQSLQGAGVMVVLSRAQLQQLPTIAVSCFLDSITGGGPVEGGFSPCTRQYYYDREMNGVPDRYFVIVGATHESYCNYLQSFHSGFSPQDFVG